MLMQI